MLFFRQILKTTIHKTAAVQLLTSYFTNNSSKTNKTCGALLYGCTTWMLIKHLENKARLELHKNATCYFFDRSRKQQSIKQQQYSCQPPISQTTQVRLTRHVGHCWRSKDLLITKFSLELLRMDAPVLANLFTSLCIDTGCSQDQLRAIYDTDGC